MIHREVGRRHFPGNTALEVDAEVQALEQQRSDGHDQQRRGDGDAPPAASVEIDRGLAVIQAPTETAALMDLRNDLGAHVAAAETSIPITLRRDIHSVRDISSTAGRVKK